MSNDDDDDDDDDDNRNILVEGSCLRRVSQFLKTIIFLGGVQTYEITMWSWQ